VLDRRTALTAALLRCAETLLLGAIVVAPWPYGSAGDPARYGLTSVVLFALALGTAARGDGWPALGPTAVALPAFALMQIALGRSVAPVWTAEAALVLAAMLGALVFWSDRGRDADAALRLTLTVLVTCLAQAIVGAVQWQTSPGRIYGAVTPIVTSPFGSFVDHNHFAGFVEMGAVLAAGMAWGHARRSGGISTQAILLGGGSAALVAAHLAARSRGGLVALAGGLLLLAFGATLATKLRGRTTIWLMAGGTALLAFGLAVVPETTREHLASVLRGGGDASAEYRVDIAAATLRLAMAKPVMGSGLGAYADAVPQMKRGHGDVRTTHAESDALELLAEGGLAACALVLLLARALWRPLRERLQEGHDPFRKGIALGAMAGAGALLVHSLFDFNLRLPANALVFASLAGLGAAPRAEPARRGGAWLAAILLALGAAAAGWRAVGARELEATRTLAAPLRIAALDRLLVRHGYLAEAWRDRGSLERARAEGAFASARLERAKGDLMHAVALRPRWGEAWAELGLALLQQGKTVEAEQALARASELDPTHPGIAAARARLPTSAH
jgi:hypothetical protein